MSTPQLAIEVQDVSGSNRIPSEQLFRSWGARGLRGAGRNSAPAATAGGELTIRIVGERESADLNNRYRGKRGPTNVLSFLADLSAPPGGGEPEPEEAPQVERVAEPVEPPPPPPSSSEGNVRPRGERGTLKLRERDGNAIVAAPREAADSAPADGNAAEVAPAGDEQNSAVSTEGVEPGSEVLPLGDLVICAPVLAREAREQRKQFEAHWAHIVIHGVLHLIGYDHETDEQAGVMEDRERKILAALGFSDPYAVRS